MTCEEAAPQDRPDAATTVATTVTPPTSILLRHALATGDASVIAVVRRIVDGHTERQATPTRVRRERLFDLETIERLEMDDRRRDAARRLPPGCPFSHHAHTLGCHDPLADVG